MAWSINLSQVIGSGSPIAQAVVAMIGLAGAAPTITISSSGAPFDFFISATGSDSNPGTKASPWAITAINTKQATYAGKRVGVMAGTYDVSGAMNPTFHTPVLNVNGGPFATKTYIASCDANGAYSPWAATIDGMGASGLYGGGNSNISSIIGCGHEVNVPAIFGNWTIDGLRIIRHSMWAVHFGNYDAVGGAVVNAALINCEITGGNDQFNTASGGVNCAAVVGFTGHGCVIENNFIHDNLGPGVSGDATHFSGMYVWGLGTSSAAWQVGLKIRFNTLANTGNIHSKEATQYNAEVAYNVVDMTNKTPSGGPSSNAACISGFNSDGHSGAATGTIIHHNILIGSNGFIDTANDTGQNGWWSPISIYSNTMVLSANWNNAGSVGIRMYEMSAGLRLYTGYGNLFASQGFTVGSNYGWMHANADFAALNDWNCYIATSQQFSTVPNGQNSGTANVVHQTTPAAWQAATGSDANSIFPVNVNPFSNQGGRASQFKVTAGVAFMASRVGGVSGGAPMNHGAWDSFTLQVGCVINGAEV